MKKVMMAVIGMISMITAGGDHSIDDNDMVVMIVTKTDEYDDDDIDVGDGSGNDDNDDVDDQANDVNSNDSLPHVPVPSPNNTARHPTTILPKAIYTIFQCLASLPLPSFPPPATSLLTSAWEVFGDKSCSLRRI